MAVPFEQIVKEDLNIGYGTVSVTMPAGGTATGHKVGAHSFGLAINVKDFGAVGDDATDDTAAFVAAYTAALNEKLPLWIPGGTYRFSGGLTWNKPVNVFGAGREVSLLRKTANVDGITVTYPFVQLVGFGLDTTAGARTSGDGLVIDDPCNFASVRDVAVTYQGGDGMSIKTSLVGSFANVSCNSNIGNGMKLASKGLGTDQVYASHFSHIHCNANGGVGFYGYKLNACTGEHIVCESNGGHGFELDTAVACVFSVYGESNTGEDIVLTANSIRNVITVFQADSTADLVDDGLNNAWIDFGQTSQISAPAFGRKARQTNIAGLDVIFGSGSAGAGATGRAGGVLYIISGDAKGTTGDASGGTIYVQGGAKVNSGAIGQVQIQPAGGQTLVGGDSAGSASSIMEVQGTTGGFRVPNVTAAQRGLIATPAAGTIVFDTDTGKLNFYTGAAWEAVTSA